MTPLWDDMACAVRGTTRPGTHPGGRTERRQNAEAKCLCFRLRQTDAKNRALKEDMNRPSVFPVTGLRQFWSCPGSVDSFSSSFLDLVSINFTPQARSAAAGGRSSERIFSSARQKSTAYKAPGAEISIDPWHWHPRKSHPATVWHS